MTEYFIIKQGNSVKRKFVLIEILLKENSAQLKLMNERFLFMKILLNKNSVNRS